MSSNIGIRQAWDLVIFRAYAELRRDTMSAYLGILWWVIDPLLYLGAFYLIFAVGIRSGGDHFASFLLCGLAGWKLFASSLAQGAPSLITYKSLIQQIYLPKYLIPLIPIVINSFKFMTTLILLFLFLILAGPGASGYWWYLPIVIAVELIFVVGVTSLVAAIIPFVQDLRLLVGNGITALMFLSGIFYQVETFPEDIQFWFYLNPMVIILDAYRDVLLYQQPPAWLALGSVVMSSVVLLAAALYLLIRYDRQYPKVLI